MAAPSMTFNAAGNLLTASTVLHNNSTQSFDWDISTKLEGQMHVKNTPGGSVSASRGLQVDVYRRYGSTPTNGQTPYVTFVMPSKTASTAESAEFFLPTGKYHVILTNLDPTNDVTAEVTGDTVDSIA